MRIIRSGISADFMEADWNRCRIWLDRPSEFRRRTWRLWRFPISFSGFMPMYRKRPEREAACSSEFIPLSCIPGFSERKRLAAP